MNRRAVPRVGFVLERSLGHVTHADNLSRLLPQDPAIEAELFEVPWETEGFTAKVPVFNSNWTVRAGVRARRGIAGMQRSRPLDALFIHTQVPAVLSAKWVKRIPTVLSVDATPLQYDELGAHYGHKPGSRGAEQLKWRANRARFRQAAHIVAWSAWARDGVVDGYGIDADRITVIPPGVTPALWSMTEPRSTDDVVRILFVGGDLKRKGGDLLLAAFAQLRAERPSVELHLVTKTDVPANPGVTVHATMEPNSAALVALYHRADVFCLPTRGDCLPMVLSEAGAAGLPLVSTAIAGIPEIVRDGETGLVVPLDDFAALVHALRTLVDDRELRARLGSDARGLVDRQFDADKNTRRLVDLIVRTVADRKVV